MESKKISPIRQLRSIVAGTPFESEVNAWIKANVVPFRATSILSGFLKELHLGNLSDIKTHIMRDLFRGMANRLPEHAKIAWEDRPMTTHDREAWETDHPFSRRPEPDEFLNVEVLIIKPG